MSSGDFSKVHFLRKVCRFRCQRYADTTGNRMNKYNECFGKFISISFSKGQQTFAIVVTLNNIISYVICIKYQLGEVYRNILSM